MVPWINLLPDCRCGQVTAAGREYQARRAYGRMRRRPPTDVGPATHAGTHNHRPWSGCAAEVKATKASRNHYSPSAPVPACVFAGTTTERCWWLFLQPGVAFPGQAVQLFILLAETVSDAG